MSSTPPDDLEAIRTIVEALNPFEPKDQERILRWAREKIGLARPMNIKEVQPPTNGEPKQPAPQDSGGGAIHPQDIRTFVDTKDPQSDNQFAATVAYYYRFEAPEADRKPDITADDLQDATRKAGRDRLTKPGQTLLNAHGQGYFDKAERGHYALSTVGENLVAMALPQGNSDRPRRATRRRKTQGPKRAPAKNKKK